MKNKSALVFSFLILGLLLSIFFPSFFFPPVGDYPEVFYFFHNLGGRNGPIEWLHVLNRDPSWQMRYQPLAYIFHYIIHRTFGSVYEVYNIVNFLFYYLSLILLYKFSLFFVKCRWLVALFLFLFAFLFSHSDILLWSLHMYIVAGLNFFLLGFICYIGFLKINKIYLVFLSGLFFLLGLWCYEPFFLWPFAILILSALDRFKKISKTEKKKIAKVNCLLLGALYFLYFAFYLLTRFFGTYEASVYRVSDFIRFENMIFSIALTLFNFFYNQIIVNIFPFFSFPLKVTGNIYMSESVIDYLGVNFRIIFIGAIFVFTIFVFLFSGLHKKRQFEEIKVLSLFVFLLFSAQFILFFCRSAVGYLLYPIAVFRYQYIPNVFFILIAVYLIYRFGRLGRSKTKIVLCLIFFPIFILNIVAVGKIVNIRREKLSDLRRMLSSVRFHIDQGKISLDNKLYLDDNIQDYLSALSWSIYKGRWVEEGNYQWMFPKEELGYFTDNPEEAAWIIGKSSLEVIKNSKENIQKKGDKIWEQKEDDYLGLVNFHLVRKEFGEAKKILQKMLELNPKSYKAYCALGNLYYNQKEYKKAEGKFRTALELSPKLKEAYIGLWNIYNNQGRYQEAADMLNRAVGVKNLK